MAKHFQKFEIQSQSSLSMSNLEEHSIVTETNLLYFPDTILRIEKLVVFAFWKIWYIFFSKFPFVFALCGLIALSMPCVSLSKICSCCQVEKFSNKEKSKQDPPSFYILHGWTLMKVWVFPKSGLHWLGRKTSLGKKKKKSLQHVNHVILFELRNSKNTCLLKTQLCFCVETCYGEG